MRRERIGIVIIVLGLACAGCSDDDRPPDRDAGADATADVGVDAASSCSGYCVLSKVAGTPGGVGSADGTKGAARFWGVSSIVSDGKVFYIADLANSAIRRFDPGTGVVTTVAGKLGLETPAGLQQDGKGDQATFVYPVSVGLLGQSLYVGDWTWLRRVDLATGQVTTVKDTKTGKPWRPAGDAAGPTPVGVGSKLYVQELSLVGELDTTTGAYQIIAGSTTDFSIVDGIGTAARFNTLLAMAYDGGDALWITDLCTVRKLELSTKKVTTVAGQISGTGCVAGIKDGTGAAARFQWPMGISADQSAVYVAEHVLTEDSLLAYNFGRVRRIDPKTGAVTTLAGEIPVATATVGELDGAAAKARLYKPWGITSHKGAVYAGTYGAVRKIAGGQLSTAAGQILSDSFISPGPIAPKGQHVYSVLNSRRELVRVDRKSGSYEVLQRYDAKTFPVRKGLGMLAEGDTVYILYDQGLLAYDTTKQTLTELLTFHSSNLPRGLATDGKALYVSLHAPVGLLLERQLWKVDPQAPGKHEVLFKTSEIRTNYGVAHHKGSIYIADGSSLARLELASKKLTRVAGDTKTSGCGAAGDSKPRFTSLCAVASDGSLLTFSDCFCHTVWQLDPATGKVTHLAGSHARASFAAGQGAAAGIAYPRYLAHDATANELLISDPADNVILRLTRASN